MQVNQKGPASEMGTLGNHKLRIVQEVYTAMHTSGKGLLPNCNGTRRILSQAEGRRGHLVVFLETTNKLIFRTANGRIRESWIPALAVGAAYVLIVIE